MGALFIGLFFMAIGWMVSSRLKSKFKEYSQVHLTRDLTGAEIARLMLTDNGIGDVQVTCVEGELTDHYNPATKTVNLSEGVFHGRNAAATAVASHECGHAVQHAQAYSMLQFRSAMVPVQNISAKVLNFMMMAMIFGSFFASSILPMKTALLIIIACYAAFALFALVTLPVEFDASRRALAAAGRSARARRRRPRAQIPPPVDQRQAAGRISRVWARAGGNAAPLCRWG